MKKKSNLIKKVIQSILVFILFYYSSYLQLIPILLFHMDIEKLTSTQNICLSLFSNIVLLLILCKIYWKELKAEWIKFKKNSLQNMDAAFRYWFLGLVGMAVSNIILNFILNAGGATNEKMVQEMITTLPILMLINAGIIAPIVEELTFRKAFKNAFQNKWLFILSSGLIFGGLHVITSFSTPLELLYIIPYSSLGISFAYMYYKTETIYTSINMHIIHNTVLTLLSILTR